MQSATVLLAALTLISTVSCQVIDFAKVDAAPSPAIVSAPVLTSEESVVVQPASVASAVAEAAVLSSSGTAKRQLRGKRGLQRRGLLAKRDGDCSVQPAGTGPNVTSPDTVLAFQNFAPFSIAAENARTPDGYYSAFTNLNGSTQTTSYLGYKTLDSYDTDACVAYCNELDGCQGVNIYFERDPRLDPNATSCSNPESVTNIKCSRWGVQVCNDTATNVGQFRDQFEVVITGSNGYNKLAPPASIPGYSGPTQLGGAMSAPLDPVTSKDTYITYQYFPFGTNTAANEIQYFNPSVCTSACSSTSQFDIQNKLGVDGQGPPAVCNMVVAYVLSDADVPQGMYCAMYTESWAPVYATNVGQYRPNSNGGSDFWSVSQAYSYVNATYAEVYSEICAVGGCPAESYIGGNCGGWGPGEC